MDVTLVKLNGEEVPMPSGFDNFTALADRDYSDCTDEAAANAKLLETIMEANGFRGYQKEWWHYTDTDSYPVEDTFDPAPRSWWLPECNEFISLRESPSVQAAVLEKIPVLSQCSNHRADEPGKEAPQLCPPVQRPEYGECV